MNTLKKIFIFILVLAQVSCEKDESITKPQVFSVKVKQNQALPYTVTSKEEIVFDLNITSGSEARIKEAVLSLDDNNLQSATASTEAGQMDLQYTYKVTGENVGRSLIFRLKVSDEEGNTTDKDFIVYVQSAPAEVAITLPSNAPSEIMDNELVDFNIAVVSENDIKYIKTYLDQSEISALTKEIFTNPKEDTYHFTYQPSAADADKTLTFTIEVMDVLGNIVKRAFSMDVRRSQTVDFNTYTGVNIGAQRATAAGPFLNSSTGEIYVTTGSATKAASIDLATFYSGSSNSYNIVSPTLATVADNIYTVALYGSDALANWPVRNRTLIKKISLTQSEFDLIASASEIEALYTGSSVAASESSGGLANNNVIVFKTAGNKYGLLLVKARSANANTGYLTVDIKVQK